MKCNGCSMSASSPKLHWNERAMRFYIIRSKLDSIEVNSIGIRISKCMHMLSIYTLDWSQCAHGVKQIYRNEHSHCFVSLIHSFTSKSIDSIDITLRQFYWAKTHRTKRKNEKKKKINSGTVNCSKYGHYICFQIIKKLYFNWFELNGTFVGFVWNSVWFVLLFENHLYTMRCLNWMCVHLKWN